MNPIDVEGINRSVNNLRVGSKQLENQKREKIDRTAKQVADLVDTLAAEWETLGLSGRESEVAAYRQLGFTNKATAHMLRLSVNTVNEYTRRANEKIDTARRLVTHADRTEAFQKDWSCRNCREGIRRSKGDIEVSPGDETVSYRCRSCWETYNRRLYSAPNAPE